MNNKRTYKQVENAQSGEATTEADCRAAITVPGARTADQQSQLVDHDPFDSTIQMLLPALAALVMRQARVSLIEGRMIAGTDKKYGSPIGLTYEDRRAMALVSRACLSVGLPDYGGEIHDLLAQCSRPLGDWLPLKCVIDAGMSKTRLISEEYGSPTPEADELAKGFSTLTAGVEELLFAKFREVLDKYPKESANHYYSKIREFVIRHPVATAEEIRRFADDIPATLWMLLQQHFYERMPYSWTVSGRVTICADCGNAMRERIDGLSCRTTACAAANQPATRESRQVDDLYRVSRGIQQYWVEPGVDELRLYDALCAKAIAADLYPYMDRVDIAVGNIGIDMKAYCSPELLGNKIRRDRGGLSYYEKKWLVVPDWLIASTPQYLDRLHHALEDAEKIVRCLSLSAALREIVGA